MAWSQGHRLKEGEQSQGHHLDTQEHRNELYLDDINKYGNHLNLSPGDVVPWRARQVKTPVPEQPFRFADLAPELRNRIAELVLYHVENEGIISPACFGSDKDDLSSAYVNGEWRAGMLVRSNFGGDLRSQFHNIGHESRDRIRVEENSKSGPSEYDMTETEQCSGLLQPYDFFHEVTDQANVNDACGHICSYLCLLQPALTLVSRQMRTDNLAIFYSINEVQIMLAPQGGPTEEEIIEARSVGTKCYLPLRLKRPLAVEIWRAIGDTLLRTMKVLALSLANDCTLRFVNDSAGCARLEIERHEQGARTRLKVERYLAIGLSPNDFPEHLRDAIVADAAKRAAENLAFEEVVREGGLCVQIIEHALRHFDMKGDWVPELQHESRVSAEEQAGIDARWAKTFYGDNSTQGGAVDAVVEE
ncbi:hypothetical protein LTR56_001801 [Elasticomyces elasticus]|nr:hypothetical protein LTR56_001801 [Elasticomyces elasticus]KAK3668849.1 hypothetical protein LTR22_000329 [Elasticomyces elasticus]KAK4924965.1 hypothetical protein LTR49_007971 [Elasticomyces elasticus]KAK5763222.1 hypothetical protein LTS12_006606 [Elasticomyces elasticus]